MQLMLGGHSQKELYVQFGDAWWEVRAGDDLESIKVCPEFDASPGWEGNAVPYEYGPEMGLTGSGSLVRVALKATAKRMVSYVKSLADGFKMGEAEEDRFGLVMGYRSSFVVGRKDIENMESAFGVTVEVAGKNDNALVVTEDMKTPAVNISVEVLGCQIFSRLQDPNYQLHFTNHGLVMPVSKAMVLLPKWERAMVDLAPKQVALRRKARYGYGGSFGFILSKDGITRKED